MNIKELIDQANEYAHWACNEDARASWLELRDEKFAALVAAAEREACAKVAESEPKVWRTDAPAPQQRIAAAIRARSKHD